MDLVNMKYLKTYHIFESIDTIINDFKDILLELSDENFNVRIKEGDHHAYSKCVDIVISKDGGNFDFWTERNIGELTPFRFGDIKDYLIRVLSYANSERWYDYNFEIVTTENLQCPDTRQFNDGTYRTPVAIKDDQIVNSYYSLIKTNQKITTISDDVKILCVYIGLGK